MDLSKLEPHYLRFVYALHAKMFFEQSLGATLAHVRGFGLIRPKSRNYQEPGEICFVYQPPLKRIVAGNDYKVIVCSTKRRVGWVGKDSGWVIIIDRAENKVYTSRPFIRRSENFFDRLFLEARIARWRVLQRPIECPQGCKAPMLLVHRRGRLKSCYWKCALHPEDRTHHRRFDDLKTPMPSEVMEQRKAERSTRRKKREEIRKAGGDPDAAFKKRMAHPWIRKEISEIAEF
jgi:hypothetical protein